MHLYRLTPGTRRGAIIPLTAVLLIPLCGLTAFAVDMGYIVMARAELQNAADAAAPAAAEQLQTYYVQYYLPSADQPTVQSNGETAAKNLAKLYAGFFKAGNASIVVLDTANDVQFGYTDSSTPFTTTVPSVTFPNTVQVTLRLDGGTNTNTQLGLFFGPAPPDVLVFLGLAQRRFVERLDANENAVDVGANVLRSEKR